MYFQYFSPFFSRHIYDYCDCFPSFTNFPCFIYLFQYFLCETKKGIYVRDVQECRICGAPHKHENLLDMWIISNIEPLTLVTNSYIFLIASHCVRLFVHFWLKMTFFSSAFVPAIHVCPQSISSAFPC